MTASWFTMLHTISLRSASAFLNSTLITAHSAALQRWFN